MSTTIKTVLVLTLGLAAVLVALSAGAFFLRAPREGLGQGVFAVTLEEGLEKARAKKRPVFLYFGASW